MRSRVAVVALASAAVLAGCGKNSCILTRTRCSGDRVQVCKLDLNDDPAWQDKTDCQAFDPPEFCDATSGVARCVGQCVDQCEAEGQTRCDYNLVDTCAMGADGCRDWVQTADCHVLVPPQVCDDASGVAECVPCQNACLSLGDRRCQGTSIEVCEVEGEFRCPIWRPHEDCAVLYDPPRACSDEGGDPVCAGCANACDAEGHTRCVDDVIQTCARRGGCLAWVESINCRDEVPAQFCNDPGGAAVCADHCMDRCVGQGSTRCVDDVVQTCALNAGGCLDWSEGTDCTAADPPRACGYPGGEAACVDPCWFTCTAGESHCEGDLIRSCAEEPNGCTAWVDDEDCAASGAACRDQGHGPYCALTCSSVCDEPGATRCDGDSVETCRAGPDGCRGWFGEACAGATPRCDASTSPAACAPDGTAETCADARRVVPPAVVAGADFGAEFDDDVTLSDMSCGYGPSEAPDAVFAVDLAAGATLVVRDASGDTSFGYAVQRACGGASCQAFGRGEVRYSAPVAGRVDVVIEQAPGAEPTPYELHFDLATDEVCDNHVDDDLDGDTDCDDAACSNVCSTEICDNAVDDDADHRIDCDDAGCFGTPACASERNCSDRADNDLDLAVDCDDSDCAGQSACLPYRAVFESFLDPALDPVDLAGSTLTFTPDAGNASGYAWSLASGVTGFAVEPGSGVVSTPVTVGDWDALAYPLGLMGNFAFYGVTYDQILVTSSGYVNFGRWSGESNPSFIEWVFPHVVLLYGDFDLEGGGSLTIDEFADRVVVTYDGVPVVGDTQPNQVQMILAADGTITLAYVQVHVHRSLVGLLSGVGRPPYPAETDFTAATPENCIDGHDNDGDGAVDCDDTNCWYKLTCRPRETACGDGVDNDLDALPDCKDPDCAAELRCIPETACSDAIDNDLDTRIDCSDWDCMGKPGCTTETGYCHDYWDNDKDGQADCQDPDCAADPACP